VQRAAAGDLFEENAGGHAQRFARRLIERPAAAAFGYAA